MWKSDRAVPARQNGRVNPIRCRPQVSCWNRVRSVNFRVFEGRVLCFSEGAGNIHVIMYDIPIFVLNFTAGQRLCRT